MYKDINRKKQKDNKNMRQWKITVENRLKQKIIKNGKSCKKKNIKSQKWKNGNKMERQ